MYRLINERATDIGRAMTGDLRDGAIQEYNWLLSELRTRDVAADMAYQRRFRAFWRIRCSTSWGSVYFSILEREKTRNTCDPVAVAQELLRIPSRQEQRTLQFSFATKLAHMVNPNQPIYDKMVCTFFLLDPPDGADDSDRLNECRDIFKFLVAEYARVIRTGLLHPAIKTFRNLVPDVESHTDTKVIDWMIWQFVDLAYRNRWILRGICKYAG